MSKKIALYVSSFNLGGVERAFITLANSFIEDGYKVDFIVSINEGVLKNELNENVNIVDLKCKKLRGSFFKLYRYIKKTSIDLLITGPTYPNIIAIICNLLAFKKINLVVTQHSYQDVEMNNLGLIGKLAPHLIKLTYNHAHKVVAVSKGVKFDLIDNYGIQPKKIEVIYNAVLNESFFEKSEQPIEENIKKLIPHNDYFISVGRLEIVKNHTFLLKIYAKMRNNIPDFKYDLVILGDGSERQKITEKIKDLGIEKNVHLLGAISNPLPIIKEAKILIHTSLSEAMPLVYVESLAFNIPVVTSINKGALEVLDGVEQKKIIYNYNEDEYIEGILELLDNSDFSRPPNLEKFHSDVIKDSFLSLI